MNKQTAPITAYGEQMRQTNASIESLPSVHEQTQRTSGIITKIHPKQAGWVKVRGLNGDLLANGNWIELNHNSDEIVERWGTVRTGMKVRVAYSGPAGTGADCSIVGVEDHKPENPHIPNSAEQGFFYAFSPGIGIG